MVTSRQSVLALLGLAASVHAMPASYPVPNVPIPSNQISLTPPSQSVSWDLGLPKPTEEPKTPEPYPPLIPPKPGKPSDQISLSPPSYSVSWEPGYTPPPYDSETSEKLEEPLPTPFPPKPSDDISLAPPSASVSWDTGYPTTTEVPEVPIPYPPKPSDQFSLGTATASVTWVVKRQQEDPEPSEAPEVPNEPEFPEEPDFPGDGPIIIPPFPFPTPPNTIGIQPPVVSISWGKRQDDPEPTDFPEFPEDPDDGPIDIPPIPLPTPKDTIGIQPPQASISWGKLDAEAQQTNSYGFYFPTMSFSWPKPSSAYVSWGKRQDDGPTEIPVPPLPTPPDQISIQPPQASVSWGKRDADAEPQNSWGINFPTASFAWPSASSADVSWDKREADPQWVTASWGIVIPTASFAWPKPSSAYVSWGKREAEAQAETIGLIWPTNIPKPSFDIPKPSQSGVYISWGKRDEEELVPLTKVPTHIPVPPLPPTPTAAPPKPSFGLCPTLTATMIPVCEPPKCPAQATPCDLNRPVPVMEKVKREDVDVVEKTIITIKTETLVPPTKTKTLAPAPSSCTKAVTKTVYGTCPTYTCIPWCNPVQVVR